MCLEIWTVTWLVTCNETVINPRRAASRHHTRTLWIQDCPTSSLKSHLSIAYCVSERCLFFFLTFLLFHEIFHCVIAIEANLTETRGTQWNTKCLRCQSLASLDYAIPEWSHRLKINPKLQGKCKCQDHGQRPNMKTKGLFVQWPGFMSVFRIIQWSSTVQKKKKKGKLLQRERTWDRINLRSVPSIHEEQASFSIGWSQAIKFQIFGPDPHLLPETECEAAPCVGWRARQTVIRQVLIQN